MTNATTTKSTFSLLPSAVLRAGVAAAAVAFVAGAWVQAGHSSQHAVQEARSAMTRIYVTLPRVEVVGRRDTSPVASIGSRRAL
jgi:hypothetical protein